jgi:hypothetical protein
MGRGIEEQEVDWDALEKSRLTGENRCPEFMKLTEITGFRPSPE